MSFVIQRVGYLAFRNMREYVLEPDPHLTVLVGPNAVGKTNCIEGMQILTTGTSFRHPSPADLILEGEPSATLRLHAEAEKRTLDVGYDIFPSKKLLSLNGKRRPNSEGCGIIPAILFYPDELLAIKGGAAGRRELIDGFGTQINKTYARVASDYRKALLQRNSMMKDAARTGVPLDPALFDAWTNSLVVAGSMLFLYRYSLVASLARRVERIYGELSSGEAAAVGYESAYGCPGAGGGGTAGGSEEAAGTPAGAPGGVSASSGGASGPDAPASSGAAPSPAPKREEVEASFRRMLEACRADELRRCQTLVGPHLDDVAFYVEGRSARKFGSQGQQRTMVLALKLAQVEMVRDLQGAYPLFLLDDVMSELDAERRSRLFDLIKCGMQTVVTTTNLEYFSKGELEETKVVRLGVGQG